MPAQSPEVETELHYEGGVKAFVQYLDADKTALHDSPIYIKGERDGCTVELALQWSEELSRNHVVLYRTISRSGMAVRTWLAFVAH
jgi:DNA gyrase/topoisomerase IV subunit B